MPRSGSDASDALARSGLRPPGKPRRSAGVRLGAAAAPEQAQALRLEGRFGAGADVELAVDLLHIGVVDGAERFRVLLRPYAEEEEFFF